MKFSGSPLLKVDIIARSLTRSIFEASLIYLGLIDLVFVNSASLIEYPK